MGIEYEEMNERIGFVVTQSNAVPEYVSCCCVKVLYRQEGHNTGILYTTFKQSIDLPLHKDGDYLVEVRAQSKGGDGAVAQVRISGKLFCQEHTCADVLHVPRVHGLI